MPLCDVLFAAFRLCRRPAVVRLAGESRDAARAEPDGAMKRRPLTMATSCQRIQAAQRGPSYCWFACRPQNLLTSRGFGALIGAMGMTRHSCSAIICESRSAI